jgi:HEAT repeat protein
MRPKVLTALLAALLFVLLAGLDGGAARAQRKRAPRQSGAGAPQAAQSTDRPKRVIIGRGSDSAQGSRVSIKSDDPLNDYSAYRSGDRFYVVLPRADAGAVAKGASGKGYSDMQVQQRGGDVVLSYHVQPGAKPRVEQKFNRLDVVFDVPAGGQANPAENNKSTNQPPKPSAVENKNANANGQPANQTATITTSPNTTSQSVRQPATPNGSNGQPNAVVSPSTTGPLGGAAAPGTNTPPAGVEQSSPTSSLQPSAGQTPAAKPTVEQQLAQSQPPATTAPITTTNPASATQAGTSLGTFLVRNWPLALVVALVVIGLGLIVAARRSSAATPPPIEESKAASTSKPESPRPSRLKDASAGAKLNAAEASSVTDAKPLVATSALVAGAAVASKKDKAKDKKDKTKEEEEWAEELAFAEEPRAAKPSVKEHAAGADALEEISDEGETLIAESEATTDIAPASAASALAAASVAPTAKGIVPAGAPDPESVQIETKRLLDGETYDRAVVGTTDAMARQIIAAELLSALSGRNVERGARARAAFVEHGYFDDTARDLHEAAAPAERASAARSLAIVGDRAATPLLATALEDKSVEVRRAAVESLGALRDPAAVGPLEALLEREKKYEKKQKNKVHHRIIRNAIESCREAAAQPHAATPAAAPAAVEVAAEAVVETSEVVAQEPSGIVEVEQTQEIAHVVEPAPLEEVTAEVEPFEEATAEIVPVEERAEVQSMFVAADEVSADVDEEAAEAETTFVGEAPAVDETTLAALGFPTAVALSSEEAAQVEASPSAESSMLFEIEPTETETLIAEPSAPEMAVAEPEVFEETGIQPAEETEATAPETLEPQIETLEPQSMESHSFDFAEPSVEVGEATLFEANAPASQDIREIVEAPADVDEQTAATGGEVAAGEWFNFDMSELEPASQPPAVEPPAPVFETLAVLPPSSEIVAFEAGAVVEEPQVEEGASSTQIERAFAETGIEKAVAEEVGVEVAAPVFDDAEKGVVPFDEFSTVPASIQQRLASRVASERAAAITELSHVDSDEAFHQICAAFDDEAKEVRGAAARALYELRPDRADSFTRALREASPERRRQIGAAISASGLASESISQLTGESREKTYEAFSLLFLMAKAGEVQPLIRAIEGHPNNEVRLAVVKLLALSGQKEILPAFRRLAVRGSLPTEVRSAVMEAIYQISSSQPSAA